MKVKKQKVKGTVKEGVKEPLRAEFVTEWSTTAVHVIDKLRYTVDQFFQTTHFNRGGKDSIRELVQPDSITYWDLRKFQGKKTKVTIEVIE